MAAYGRTMTEATTADGRQLTIDEPKVDDDGVMDFTPERKAIKFKVDGDIFEAVRDIPTVSAMAFTEYTDQFSKGTTDERIDAMKKLFNLLLKEESAERFMARMSDADNPIGIKTTLDVVPWLIEQYGLGRPTVPSSNSLDGSAALDDGTS